MTMASDSVRRVNDDEELGMQKRPSESAMAIATTRASQEVVAAMTVAKRFPRDERAAIARILQSCKRKGLAEAAVYSYPRGTTTVEGPSIRLAEAMAQAWGNLDFGIVELEQKNGESQVMAYAWDLETNTRQTKIFSVPHLRHTKSGAYKLTDPRDIYEMVANQGARRLRACILGVIPGDVQDSALAQCNKTLKSASSEPLIDRIRTMVATFAEVGVTQQMIEALLQHKADVISETEIVGLRKIYRSIADGMAKREDFFDVAGTATNGEAGGSRTASLADKLKSDGGAAGAGEGDRRPAGGRPGPRKEAADAPGGPGEGAAKGDEEAEAKAVRDAQDAAEEPTDAEKCMIAAEEFVGAMNEDAVHSFVVGLPKDVLKQAKQIAGTDLGASASELDWRNVAMNGKAYMLNKVAKRK